MKKSCIFISLALISLATLSFAAEEKTAPVSSKAKPAEEETVSPAGRRDLSKDELIQTLKQTLEGALGVLDFIPGLKSGTDEQGNAFYAYKGVKLEDMEKDDLDKLLGRVQNEATRIHTERINRQLESIRRANQAAMTIRQAGRVPAVIAPPPQPPKTYTPPSTPKIPKVPSAPLPSRR